MNPQQKLCVGASSGGHMTELMALLEHQDLWPIMPSVFVSTLGFDYPRESTLAGRYIIGECDRHRPFKALRTLLVSLKIVRKERPQLVVTTGSMPLALFSLVARLYGARIIWIDSISQIGQLSVSGRLVRPFADLFFVQWPELAERYDKVCYAGELV